MKKQIANNLSVFKAHYFFLYFNPESVVFLLFLHKLLGSFALVGAVAMLYPIFTGVFNIPAGVMSDYIGRRGAMILSGVLGVLTKTCYMAAIFSSPIQFLVLGAILNGFGESMSNNTSQSLFYETLKAGGCEKQFYNLFGKTNSFKSTGMAIAALLGGAILHFGSFTYVIILSLASSTVLLLVNMRMRDAVKYKKERNKLSHLKKALKNLISNPKLLLFSGADAINAGGVISAKHYMPVYLASIIPYWALGVWRFSGMIFSAVGSWYTGALSERMGKVRAFMISMVIGPALQLVALIMNNILTPIVFLTNNFFGGIKYAISTGIRQDEYDKRQRATMTSLLAMMRSIAEGLGIFAIGALAEAAGIYTALFAAVGLRIIAIPMYSRALGRN